MPEMSRTEIPRLVEKTSAMRDPGGGATLGGHSVAKESGEP